MAEINPYESPRERNPPTEPKLAPGRENLIYVAVAILVALVIPTIVLVFLCSAIFHARWLFGR